MSDGCTCWWCSACYHREETREEKEEEVQIGLEVGFSGEGREREEEEEGMRKKVEHGRR